MGVSKLSSQKDIEKASAFNVAAYCIKSQITFEEVLEKCLQILFKGTPPPSTQITGFENLLQ